MKRQTAIILDELMSRRPELHEAKADIESSFHVVKDAFDDGKKLLICGNGGSAADAEHITGELMKGFLKKRQLPKAFTETMGRLFGADGASIAGRLQGALPAIALTGQIALNTAFSNDVDPAMTFAQQVYGYGDRGDVLLGISTSGNSRNVLNAIRVAKAKGLKTIALTGKTGGSMAAASDIAIKAPSERTFEIQEYHLPIYHCLCAMLEEEFFE